MSTTSCGSSARKVLKSPATRPLWLPLATRACVAAGQAGDVAARLVEHLELESAEHRQPLDGRRRKRHDHAAGMPNSGPRTRLSTASSDCSVPSRSRPVLQRGEHHAAVGGGAGEAEADHREHAADLGLRHEDLLRPACATLVVYSSDAPEGAWMIVMM